MGNQETRKSLEGFLRLLCTQEVDGVAEVRTALAKMLVGNLTKFTPLKSGKGGKKFKNLSKIHFEEYLGLLCSLIRLAPEQFTAEESSVFYNRETSKFHTKAILQFCIDNIKSC